LAQDQAASGARQQKGGGGQRRPTTTSPEGSPVTAKQGLLATNRDGESTEMKRRTRGTHLGARKGGRGAGGADRGGAADCGGGAPAAVLCEWREGVGGARSSGARVAFYRVEREEEEAQ
jgi:hypothetical protein